MKRPLIAIINDDPAFLEFLASFLEEETSYSTVVWDDGTGSIPKLQQHMPDLIILDIRIGDQKEGFRILQLIRNDTALSEIPVIVCTADHEFVRQNAELLDSLDATVLLKPFDLEDLERSVHTSLGNWVQPSGATDLVG